ncbi:MAG: hypothetical protein RLZZ418_287 [Pseudomonadota bacterium]|jgi:hypothetical protein
MILTYNEERAIALHKYGQIQDQNLNAPITNYLLKNANYLIYRNVTANSLYTFDFSELTSSIEITLILNNDLNQIFEISIIGINKLILPATCSGVFILHVTNGIITLLNKNFNFKTPTTNSEYISIYANKVNQQWMNTGCFANYFPTLSGSETNFRSIPYYNIFNTPDFLLSGQKNLFYSFSKSHSDKTPFWENNTWTVSYSRNAIIEDSIISNLTETDIFPSMVRVRMILPPDYIPYDNAENNWDKEMGYLRHVLTTDPANLFNYISEIEIFAIDFNLNPVYLYFNSNAFPTTVILDLNSLLLPSTSLNYFNYIENLQDIQNGIYNPFWALNPRQNQCFNLNFNNFTMGVGSLPITSNIDRPPVFLQGKLSLTLAGDQLIGLSFISFVNMGLNIIYPNDLFVCNYSPYNEQSLPTMLNLLENPSTPTPSTSPIPGFIPGYKPFASGYFSFN